MRSSRSLAARRGAEHRSEREEAARGEIDPAHGALWKRVGRGIKGTPHARAEKFKEYVEENPREAMAALDDYADREVARLVREEQKRDRERAMREIDAWRDLDEERERAELAPISSRATQAKKAATRTHRSGAGSKLTPKVKTDTIQNMARKKRSRGRRSSSALAVRRHHAPARHRGRSSAKAVGKNLLAIVGAPAALALADNAGVSIPTIGAAGEAGTLGLIGFGLNYFGIIRSPLLRDASIGLLAVAAYQGVKASGIAKKGVSGDVDGDYDAGYHT
jgi:hypothetical protein